MSFSWDETEMRFQYAVVIGLGWLLAVIVGCTSGESKRISGLSSFVPRLAFDLLDENPEVAAQASLEVTSEYGGPLVVDPPEPSGNSLKNSHPRKVATGISIYCSGASVADGAKRSAIVMHRCPAVPSAPMANSSQPILSVAGTVIAKS